MRALRLLGAALSLEALRALRAPDTLKIRLLPGLLLVPLLSLLTITVMTLTDTRGVVALPASGGLDPAVLEEALDDARLQARFVEDPARLWADGEADAWVRWERGGAAPTRLWDDRGDADWIAVIQAREQDTEDRLREALLDAGDAALEARVILAGADPSSVVVAEFEEISPRDEHKSRLAQLFPLSADGRWVLGFSFLGLYGLMFSLPVLGLQERKQGVAEALLVLPAPAPLMHAARLACWTAIAAAAAGVLLAEVAVFTRSDAPLPSPGAFLASFGALALCASAMHTTGIACKSPVTAMNVGPGVGLMVWGSMLLGAHLGAPGVVPVLGLVSQGGSADLALAGLIALALCAGLVLLGARLERARIEEGA